MKILEKRRFTDAHPYLFCLGLIALYTVALVFIGALCSIFKWPTLVLYIGGPGLVSVAAALLLTRLGWWRAAGFHAPAQRRDLIIFWLPLLCAFVPLLAGITTGDPWALLWFLPAALFAGFAEETIFRGMMLRALVPTGLWRATLVSAVVFGLMHSLNVLAGSNALYVGLQICYATAIGFGLSAAVLRSGLLWPLVITHALQDFVAFSASNGPGSSSNPTADVVVLTVVITIAFTIYGIVLLRSVPGGAHRPAGGYAQPQSRPVAA